MMDWTTIIVTMIGMVGAAGSVGGFLYYKANKGGATADAIDKSAEAMKKLLDNFAQQQDQFNKTLEDRDKSIRDRDELIDEYKKTIDALKKEVHGLKYTVSENERKLAGLQEKLNNEIASRKELEQYKCIVEGCKLRQPPRENKSA